MSPKTVTPVWQRVLISYNTTGALAQSLLPSHTQLSLSSSSKGVLAVILSGGIGFTVAPPLNVEFVKVDDEDVGGRCCAEG